MPVMWRKNNLPKSIVEVVDPIALTAKLVESSKCKCCCSCDISSVPDYICQCFSDELAVSNASKRVFVSLGLFTIIKIERNVQLLIPAIDFCIPQKECLAATEENPCELFNSLRFPIDEFFPPQKSEFEGIGGNDDCSCK